VPILTTTTRGYPFLRLRKPQSPFLSRVLRQKIKQRQQRFDTVDAIDVGLEYAEAEAEWERNVMEQLAEDGVPNKEWMETEGKYWDRGSPGWTEAAARAKEEVLRSLMADQRKAKEVGEKMLDIVDKERELWRQERGRRRHEKKVAKKLRKQETANSES